MAVPLAFVRGKQLLADGELADAIRAFLDAVAAEPDHVESYFGLMRAYELAFEVYPDPELLHQVGEVLRGLRDCELDDAERARADEVEHRVEAALEAAGHPPRAPGRTPPAD